MRTITTKLHPTYNGNRTVLVFASAPDVEVGELVRARFASQDLGVLKVYGVREIALGDITYKDLAGSIYGAPAVFWQRFESSVGSGQPAEASVFFVTLGPETEETVEEFDDEPSFEQTRRKRTVPRKKENPAAG